MKRRRPIAMLSDGAFAVCGYYSTRKIILQGVLFRNLHAVDKYGPHLGHDLEGAAVRDDDVRVLAQKPGNTSRPSASKTTASAGAVKSVPMAAILPSANRMSALQASRWTASWTRPPRMRVVMIIPPLYRRGAFYMRPQSPRLRKRPRADMESAPTFYFLLTYTLKSKHVLTAVYGLTLPSATATWAGWVE